MKSFLFLGCFFLVFFWEYRTLGLHLRSSSKKSSKILQNGPIASPHMTYHDKSTFYPDYRFSQSGTYIQEQERLQSQITTTTESNEKETNLEMGGGGGGGGGDKPAFTLNIHAPQESTEEIIDSIKDLKTLVNDERKAADDDFLIEKKKLVEAQRIRVRDIVHSSFEAVNSLIPNPIKSVIRNTLNKKDTGGSDEASKLIDKAENSAKNVVNDAKNAVNNVVDNAKNAAGGLLNKAKGLFG